MSPNIIYVVSIFFFSCIFFHAGESSNSCPIFKTKPPQDAYSPINVMTKIAICANISTKTYYKNTGIGPVLFKNTGYYLESYGDPKILSGGFLEGGVLCNIVYRLAFLRFYVSNDLNGRSYNLIDGEGSPLTLAAHFYDPKYGSFKEALKHPGGVVINNYMITYYRSPIPNPAFSLTGLAVRFFHFPGIAFPVGPEILFFLWFSPLFFGREYYAFWGSYFDPETGKNYPNVIQLQTAGIHPFLSKRQIELFHTLLNKDFSQMKTVPPLHPGAQTIYQVGPFPPAFGYIPTDFP